MQVIMPTILYIRIRVRTTPTRGKSRAILFQVPFHVPFHIPFHVPFHSTFHVLQLTLTLYCKQRNNVANNDVPEVLERWWSQQPASAEGRWWGCSWGHGSACGHHSHLSHKVGPVVDSTQLHSVGDVGRNLFIRVHNEIHNVKGQWSLA